VKRDRRHVFGLVAVVGKIGAVFAPAASELVCFYSALPAAHAGERTHRIARMNIPRMASAGLRST
jgi:hypothetical protein